MDSKIMQIFYGNDCLPYKDKERTIHYPVIGNSFTGANNTTQLRFYVRDIGGTNNVSWVAVSKLPNGQIGNKVLSSPVYDAEIGEFYLALDLSSYYTSIKGEVYISLNGYQGGVLFEQDPDTGIYEISGTPTIQATGVVKIAINYAPQIIEGTHFEEDDLQQILGLVAEKLDITKGIFVYDSQTDLTGLSNGQLLFNIEDGAFYQLSSGSPVRYTLVYSKSDIDALLSQKVNKTNEASKLYGTDSDGNPAIIPVEDETGDVARRDNSGQLVVPLNPSYNGNATSKKYVDGFGYSISATIDTTTYVMTLKLKDKGGNDLSTQTVDLPLESVVVGGSYDDATESIILTLNNGNTITIPVSDLVSGLVSTADLNTALALYYTKTETDTLLGGKANTSGDYPELNVGKAEVADNLTPYAENSGSTQQTPFVFQSSAGGSDTANYALLKKLQGKSYKLTQLVNGNFTALTQWYYVDTVATFTISDNVGTLTAIATGGGYNYRLQQVTSFNAIAGHKYLVKTGVKLNAGTYNSIIVYFQSIGENGATISETYTIDNKWNELGFIFECKTSYTNPLKAIRYADGDNVSIGDSFSVRNYQLFDLTEMFGAGNEPTSVVEFNRLFTKGYYAKQTTLVNSKSSSYQTIGFNAFDGEIEGGIYNSQTGLPYTSTNAFRGKNAIKVVAGQLYACAINPSIDELGGTQYTAPEIYEYDGDGNFIRKQETTDNYSRDTDRRLVVYQLSDNTQYIRVSVWSNGTNWEDNPPAQSLAQVLVFIYWDNSKNAYEDYNKTTHALPNIDLRSVGSVYDEIDYNGTYIKRIEARAYSSGDESDSSVLTDGTTTFYVLDDPIYSTATGWSMYAGIDNWGTQEFIGNDYPQGNLFFYPVDYKAFIDSLGVREDINFDADNFVSHDELDAALADIGSGDMSEYVSLSTDQTIESNKRFDTGKYISFGSATTYYTLETNAYDQFIISRVYNGGAKTGFYVIDGYTFRPATNGNNSLGSAGQKWKDIYLSDGLKDGTYTISVAEIANQGYVVLSSHTSMSGLQGGELYSCITKGAYIPTFASFNGAQRQNIFIQFAHISGNNYKVQGMFMDTSRNTYLFEGQINGISDGSTTNVSYQNFVEIKLTELSALITYAKAQGWIS